MAVNMLVAYYSRGCDSKEMFSSEAKNVEEMIKFIEEDVISDITKALLEIIMPRRVTFFG